MGNVVIGVSETTPLPGGQKMIKGTLKMSTSYATGGDALNLVNYLYNSAVPFVTFTGGSNKASTEFYIPSHDGGTVESGKVRLIAGSAAAGETKLLECNASKDASAINVGFIAIGQGF